MPVPACILWLVPFPLWDAGQMLSANSVAGGFALWDKGEPGFPVRRLEADVYELPAAIVEGGPGV